MPEEKTVLFSEVLHAGRRTYSFDVTDSPGGIYLSIRQQGAAAEPEPGVTVSFEHVAAFGQALQKAARFIADSRKAGGDSSKPISLENSYAKWSSQDDAYLKDNYGRKTAELARELRRAPNAIRSRIKKLGLREGK